MIMFFYTHLSDLFTFLSVKTTLMSVAKKKYGPQILSYDSKPQLLINNMSIIILRLFALGLELPCYPLGDGVQFDVKDIYV
jgi:hypothetical protein